MIDRAALVWFRQDLRLADNPALLAAVAAGGPIIPVYIWSPAEEGDWPPGSASRWWLHHSLAALDESLRARGSRLILAEGPTLQVLQDIAARTGVAAVYWNKRYEPAALQCSGRVESGLRRSGLRTQIFNGALLQEPAKVANQSGKPYQVYTAFLRNLLRVTKPEPALPAPRKLPAPRRWPHSAALSSLRLLPQLAWAEGLGGHWTPGEAGAHLRLKQFLRRRIRGYREAREIPSLQGTSLLSPHLHFGEIGPRQIWHALGPKGRTSVFLREIVWREFAHHLLYHFPHTPLRPLRQQFEKFRWRTKAADLRAWQRGATGIPLVDAGMRELWSVGWMHNRVRMVVGSLLVKNLLVPWQEGARWFWDTLVDADLANNTLNWQWVAGCGADAAPYFRIFNPITQAKRFDPDRVYIQRWVPELHSGEGVSPAGKGRRPKYPAAIVDLKASRERALDAYHQMRRV